eukprot:c7959_g1_i1.p1 GENE.c7959_g1_i1~~c7959_g1_i1.p1  ORF type:complete len:126 (-),score=29.21 c7959_g1_i1:48-425(-)
MTKAVVALTCVLLLVAVHAHSLSLYPVDDQFRFFLENGGLRLGAQHSHPSPAQGGSRPAAPSQVQLGSPGSWNPFAIPDECSPSSGAKITAVPTIKCFFKPPWLWLWTALYLHEQEGRYGPMFSI